MSFQTQAFPRFRLFSREQSEAIHYASLEILRRTGVRVYHAEALQLLRQAGALISDENLVRIPPDLVEWALAGAPSRIVLCRRGSSAAAVKMEGMNTSFGPGSDCPNFLDPRTGEHRLFKAADVVDCIRLVDALEELDFCMSMGIPSDVDGISPYRHQFALMIQNTVKPIVFISADKGDCEAIVAMAAAAAGGMEKLRLNPTLLGYSQVTTPLIHPEDSTGKLLYLAEMGIPIVHQPSPMMGGTAPLSLAGALALGNAEVLSGLVMHQLKKRGAPFVYGNGVHHMDMQTTISVYGAPEFDLARAAVAAMAQYYHLPNWGYAGCSDSCLPDEQAASDATASVLVALLTGQHLAHDVGYLEAGLTTSPEMIVLTAEIIARMRYFARGFSLDESSLLLELIDEIGPGGTFLTSEHTYQHFRDLWQPRLSNRRRKDEWIRQGSLRLGERLREKTIAIMESHRPEPPPDSLRDEIAYILSQ